MITLYCATRITLVYAQNVGNLRNEKDMVISSRRIPILLTLFQQNVAEFMHRKRSFQARWLEKKQELP